MSWKTKRGMWDWQRFLTVEESAFIREADRAASRIEAEHKSWSKKYGRERQLIVNRAIHRAKYDAATQQRG